jgi:hypothetical protein
MIIGLSEWSWSYKGMINVVLCEKKRLRSFEEKMTFLDSKWFGVSVGSIWEIRNGLSVLHYVWFWKTMVLE